MSHDHPPTSSSRCSLCGTAANVAAILGTLLLLAWLVHYVRGYLAAPPVNQARIQERKNFLKEIRSASAEGLHAVGWADQAKGFVRLPISNALELIVREWQTPAAAWSNMVARADKAGAPPPKAPEKPSEYE
jgi:hypothetical protein